MTSTHPDSETYGERLYPQIIDKRARSEYSRSFAMFPKSTDPSDGFESVSYQRLANAVNRVCWWLEAKFPRVEDKENPFAYFGPNDLRYIVFFFAVWKTGRKILFASPKNTVEAQLSLFEKVNCKNIISCHSQDRMLEHMLNAGPHIHKVHAPTLYSILTVDYVPHYPYEVTFRTAANYDIVTIHTSGTSGNPKPVGWNTKYLSKIDQGNDLPIHQGVPLVKTTLSHENALCLLPCFHAGGLTFHIFAIIYEMTLVFGYPSVPMTAEYVAQLLKPTIINLIVAPPSILEDLSKDPTGLQDLAKLKHVSYGGGPLRPEVGNFLSGVLPHLFSFLGGTEMGWNHLISGGNEVWDSMRWYENIGYEFEEISEGVFEQVIVNDKTTNKYQVIFDVFPDLPEFRTKDLYSPHPTAPGWWKYRGRADDLIVLSNGEKINPIPMENVIRSNPLVKSALIIGEYQFSPSLLVEMASEISPETDAERVETVKRIWPSIEEANRIAPGFAKISKSLIFFSTPGKPFLRAGKGTVQRQMTVKLYSKELDQLFLSQQTDLLIEGLTLDSSRYPGNVEIFTKQIYSQVLEINDLHSTSDVFHNGMDSLKVLLVIQRFRAAAKTIGMSINLEDINARLIYSAPSVEKMSGALLGLANKAKAIGEAASTSRENKMKGLLEKYVSSSLSSVYSAGQAKSIRNILLTGTTGSLGSYLLAVLESMPRSEVSKIYCLNRSPDSKDRQKKSNLARGLNTAWNNERVEFLRADLSQPDLGLEAEKYAELLNNTTVIIHVAWHVNFNLSLESFEPQIRGVRNLLEFSAQSTHQAPLIFVSSVSTVHRWMESHPNAMVPEALLDDFDAPEKIGYAESKFVSEHLIRRFSTSSGIPSVILRTGQIAGPLQGSGVWNKNEWLPSIITSSKHLGVLPEKLGIFEVVDWIPVDTLAATIVELVQNSLHHNSSGTKVYNLVNPRPTTWSALAPHIQRLAGIKRMIALRDWVGLLEESSHEKNGAIVEINPALKLLDFMRGLSLREMPSSAGSMYEVKALTRDSQQAAGLTKVTAEWMQLWIRQWRL
ncbi:putative NRPS-like enzyme [Stipitochalara longipes BDJ]|nr:putative NRPS-like enzyme [Stipitochalara longipes BDJ]